MNKHQSKLVVKLCATAVSIFGIIGITGFSAFADTNKFHQPNNQRVELNLQGVLKDKGGENKQSQNTNDWGWCDGYKGGRRVFVANTQMTRKNCTLRATRRINGFDWVFFKATK